MIANPMPHLPFITRRNRLILITIPFITVLLIAYVALLNQEERATAEHYAELRNSDVQQYLVRVKQLQGFKAYLREYLEVYDYTKPNEVAPGFVVGRWALYDEEKRVSESFLPEVCNPSIQVEDGHIKVSEKPDLSGPTNYTISGQTLKAHLAGGATIAVDMISFGVHLHHIEVKLPGSDKVRYGYMCR